MTGMKGSGDKPGVSGHGARARSGYVALVGPPNAGKSALMNALVGEKLAAVTPKAQTTWRGLTGIRTESGRQMIFLDTPGVLEETYVLHRALTRSIERAVHDADVVVVVLDPTRGSEARRGALLGSALEAVDGPAACAVNKVDAASEERVAQEEEWARGQWGCPTFRVSAEKGMGLEELLAWVGDQLPEGPYLYPEDDVAAEPVRAFVVEIIREVVFEQFGQEVPYAVMPSIEEYREEPTRTYIAVTLHVERESQKGIVVGRGGRAIRGLGTEARARIEAFLGTSVYLDVWVKVLVNWRKKAKQVRRFGFELPQEGSDRSGSRAKANSSPERAT